jgi:hypothetical protein
MSALAARLARHPLRWIVAAFVALPAALFGIPTALGTPVLVGDNLIQNYPLRTLVGVDLRHGHLPLWDPFLWSGSPLLAAFNAGAAYPGTVLFAALPDMAAWATNEALVAVVASTGMLALLRALGRSWVAATLAAVAFTYGGFIAAQSVHIDIVQAGAWLPWEFLALDRLAHRPAGRSALPWVALLGTAIGLMILTGAVEPILDAGVVLALYALWLAWRSPHRRVAILTGAVAGVALGVLVGAAQLLPGAALQAESQRAAHTYWYFTSGSMNKSLTILTLDPLLLGGDHAYPLTYYGTYNLAEIAGYVGILPVMAVFGLLGRRNRRSAEASTWWVWYAIGALGLVLTWGGFTPVGHLLYHLPLFNRQRLLSRNLLTVDLALCVLFAAWIDRTFPRRSAAPTERDTSTEPADPADPADAPTGRGQAPWRLTSDVVLALVPVLAVVALQVALLAGGTWFPHVLHVPGPVSRSSLWPLVAFLSVPSAIALGAGLLVVYRRRLRAMAPVLLAAVLTVDLVLFNVTTQIAPTTDAASSPQSAWANQLAVAVAAAGPGAAGGPHRIAFFNPDRFYPVETDQIGEPDLTIVRRLGSIQGYGAIVNGAYEAATSTHVQLTLDPKSLGDGAYARLDLGLLVSVPEYFLHLLSPPPGRPATVNGAVRLPPVPPDPSAVPDTAVPGPTPAGDYPTVGPPPAVHAVAPGAPRTWFFGTVLGVRVVTVPLAGAPGAPSPSPSTLELGVVSADGRSTRWVGAGQVTGGAVVFSLDTMALGSGITLRAGGTSPWPVRAPVVATAGQGTYRLDGSLTDDVTAPRWRFAGMVGIFPTFTEAGAAGRAWVEGASGSARIARTTPWGDESISVRTPVPSTLVRNVQFATGWQATVHTVGPGTGAPGTGPGTTRAAAVERHGLVQSVAVPAGTSVVTFTYRPHRVVEGMAASAVGVVAIVLCFLAPGIERARRRRARADPANTSETVQK